MPGFFEEALKKLNKDDLIVIIQMQDVKHKRHEQKMANLFAKVSNFQLRKT